MQISLEGCLRDHQCLHVCVEKAQGVATGLLGLVQCDFDLLEELFDRVPRLTKKGHADAGAGTALGAIEQKRGMEAGNDPGTEIPSPRLGLQGIGSQVGHEHDEVIAAQVGHRITGGDRFAQARGDLPQQLITEVVAQSVVDGLEVVQIDVEKRA